MPLTTTKQRFSLILHMFLRQSLAAIALAAIVFLAFDGLAAKSVLLGAYCIILPHSLFTWYVFRFRGELNPQLVLKSVYRGETIKFLTTALLAATAFKHATMTDWLFFCGLFFMVIVQVVLSILINYDNWD